MFVVTLLITLSSYEVYMVAYLSHIFHEAIGICGISIAFGRYIFVSTCGFSMENVSCSSDFFLYFLYVQLCRDYIIRSHDQKCHVASHFNKLDSRNAMCH